MYKIHYHKYEIINKIAKIRKVSIFIIYKYKKCIKNF